MVFHIDFWGIRPESRPEDDTAHTHATIHSSLGALLEIVPNIGHPVLQHESNYFTWPFGDIFHISFTSNPWSSFTSQFHIGFFEAGDVGYQ